MKIEYLRVRRVGKLTGRNGIKVSLFAHTLFLHTTSVVFPQSDCTYDRFEYYLSVCLEDNFSLN